MTAGRARLRGLSLIVQLTARNVSTVITSTRVLLVALVLIAGWYAWTWFAIERRRSPPAARSARGADVALGFRDRLL